MIIGRKHELRQLRSLINASESQFVAVYGRRRVGKTFLIREAFEYKFTFQHSGIFGAPKPQQIKEFCESLFMAGLKRCRIPRTWSEALRLLSSFVDTMPQDGTKKILFIDELPWMDTPKSNFLSALEHFWNSWATTRKDIILIVCGSATSWIINNIIMNYGGLHNRLTCQMFIEPFNLYECKEYCESKSLGYNDGQILEAYMALGGIPYYWSFLERGKSVAQNFDLMFFKEKGPLVHEIDALYASIFRVPKVHLAIIKALAQKKIGMLRDEILLKTRLSDNEAFSNALKELIQCGFIRKYTPIDKMQRGCLFQLLDNFTLFYYDIIARNDKGDEHFWTSHLESTLHNGWAGRAFERVCLQHIPQIKFALGISGVICSAHSWTYRSKGEDDPGVQIDLLIDRNDQVINLCEIKYSKTPLLLSHDEYMKIQNRKAVLIDKTKTSKSVMPTMITSYGLVRGGYSDEIPIQLTMADLFTDIK